MTSAGEDASEPMDDIPTTAEDAPVAVVGSHCSVQDEADVFSNLDTTSAQGLDWGGERCRDVFHTSWVGGLIGGDR